MLRVLSLYEELDQNEASDITISLVDSIAESDVNLVNPSIHKEIEDGFMISFGKYDLRIQKIQETLRMDLRLEHTRNPLVKLLKRMNNIQYETVDERIDHIFFENLIIPSVYFDPSKFLVHSVTVKNHRDDVILIGGTGGVGKTSLEIELCLNRGYGFLSDDMVVIGEGGEVFPNLAFPKIYGYNSKNNPQVQRMVFKNRTLADKLAWKLRLLVLGPSNVRRKISPLDIFTKCSYEPAPLSSYFFLAREYRDKIALREIAPERAAEITVKVAQAENVLFNNHILWHEFNCLALEKSPILSLSDVLERWTKSSKKALANVPCYLLSIPINLDHATFVREAANLIEEWTDV